MPDDEPTKDLVKKINEKIDLILKSDRLSEDEKIKVLHEALISFEDREEVK